MLRSVTNSQRAGGPHLWAWKTNGSLPEAPNRNASGIEKGELGQRILVVSLIIFMPASESSRKLPINEHRITLCGGALLRCEANTRKEDLRCIWANRGRVRQ